MAIKEETATVKLQTYVCNNCRIGEMKAGSHVLMSHPPQFPHKCDHCGFEENYTRSFPRVAFFDAAGKEIT